MTPTAGVPAVPILEAVLTLTARVGWTAAELRAHRRRELAATLHHAVAHAPFHRERLAPLELDSVDPDDLSALPTMTKRDLMTHWDEIVTDPRLTLARARTHLDRVDREGPSALDGEYLVLTSGGSTGEPGVFCWSLAEMARFAASSIRWSAAAGLPPPARTAWVAARSARHPSGLGALLSGDGPEMAVPVDQPLDAIVTRLNALQPDALQVVCSMLPALVGAARAGRLRIPVARIAVFGDLLDPDAAAEAADVFGVAPLEGYPTTDVGYVAQQAPGETGLYVNDDLLAVEVVDEHDRRVAPGVLGNHLLVTSLHQRTLPLVRYRIDDRVVVDPELGRHAAYRRLASIDGRSDEVLRYDGVAVHPHVFRSAIGRHLDVRDYEVRQTRRGARVTVEAPDGFAVDALRADLRRALASAGLPDAELEVTAAATLPRTAVGKRRRFVPM